MPDRNIPFFNMILRCDRYAPARVDLPDGFFVVRYRDGYEKNWARLEHAIGDFDSEREAEDYYAARYLQRHEDCLFLLNPDKQVIGSGIAWQDMREDSTVSSLHWLVVDETYQGRGLGRALCLAVMNRFSEKNGMPVYIHTQPWSWKAVLLYISLGFRIQKTDTFSDYTNQYEEAMETLKNIVSGRQYELMLNSSERQNFDVRDNDEKPSNHVVL